MTQTLRHRRRRTQLKAEINVVPYIDVMLVLLIIFMITAPLIHQGVKVDLPQASSQPVPPADEPPVIVSVNAQGQVFLNQGSQREEPLDQQTLINRVAALLQIKPGTQVLVNGDRTVPYARVVELMVWLQQSGVPSVGLMTESPAATASSIK